MNKNIKRKNINNSKDRREEELKIKSRLMEEELKEKQKLKEEEFLHLQQE